MEKTLEELAAIIGKSTAYIQKLHRSQPHGQGLLKKRGKGYDLSVFVRRMVAMQGEESRKEMLLRELAALVGKTERRIQQINTDLAEDEKLLVKGDGGKYDLATFILRWTAYWVKQEKGETLNFENIKAQHELVKMEKSELELRLYKGELAETDTVRELWAEIAVSFRNRMMGMGGALAGRLQMQEDFAEIKRVIDDEVRAALTLLSECKLPEVKQLDIPEESEETEKE